MAASLHNFYPGLQDLKKLPKQKKPPRTVTTGPKKFIAITNRGLLYMHVHPLPYIPANLLLHLRLLTNLFSFRTSLPQQQLSFPSYLLRSLLRSFFTSPLPSPPSDKCTCYTRPNGQPAWTEHDCSLRTCPTGPAWVGMSAGNNNAHPVVPCSGKGTCDPKGGVCTCFPNYEGMACERSICPNSCSGRGLCLTEQALANTAGATYATPWDAQAQVGCLCDLGFRGPDCSLIECPGGADVLLGSGSTMGHDCSGRGVCDYTSGLCGCFTGFFGYRCEQQTVLA